MFLKELEYMITRSSAVQHYIINCDIEISGFDLERVRTLFSQQNPGDRYSYIQDVGIADADMREADEFVDLTCGDVDTDMLQIPSVEVSELGSTIADEDMHLFASDMEWSGDESTIGNRDYDTEYSESEYDADYSESEDDSTVQSSQCLSYSSDSFSDSSSIDSEYYSQTSNESTNTVLFFK